MPIEKPETLRVRNCRWYAFGCTVAIRGGYWMVRGWHYPKLSLSSALLLFFFLHVLCVTVPFFFFSCSRWDVPLIFFLSSRPRTGLATTYITGYMVEARSVNVKNATAATLLRNRRICTEICRNETTYLHKL